VLRKAGTVLRGRRRRYPQSCRFPNWQIQRSSSSARCAWNEVLTKATKVVSVPREPGITMNTESNRQEQPDDQTHLEQLLRIATGREKLEQMFRQEVDAAHAETIYNAWAEAMCV
jgi:hypothetical protein